MFLSTISRALAYAARSWRTMVVVSVVSIAVAAVGSYALVLIFADGHPRQLAGLSGAIAIVGTVLLIAWAQLAITRSAWPRFGVVDALEGAIRAAPRAIPLVVLLGIGYVALALAGIEAADSSSMGTVAPVGAAVALVAMLFVLVPLFVAMGALARDEPGLGLRRAWQVGARRTMSNLPIALGAIVVAGIAIALVVAAALLAQGVVGESAAQDGGTDLLAFIGITLVGALPAACLATASIAAVHDQAEAAADEASWAGEDLTAVKPAAGMSTVVERLIESSSSGATHEPRQGDAPRRAPRLSIPPRAPHAGRLPGPGVMRVGEVVLPAGALAREVTSETLELDGLVVRTDDDTAHIEDGATMWITAHPHAESATLWKQLAAEFRESGLWPLLVPDATSDDSWVEQPGLRLRGAHDGEPGAEQVLVPRLEASLIDTPIRDVERLRASELARGGLARSTGRRADAIGATIGRLGDARIALVPVERPADVPTMVAWPGLDDSGIASDELSSVIAAWERTYGALLVAMTTHALVFAVVRPPATEAEAIEIVAQQHALCPDEALPWTSDVEWAATLVDAPMWTLTWA